MKYRDFKVFVEGVEIPFLGATVDNAFGSVPTARIEVPPHTSLSALCKNYQPKVHIFFLDPLATGTEDSDYKQLFSGVITGIEESKYNGADGAQRSMSLSARHSVTLLQQILVRFGAQSFLAPVETQVAISQSNDISHEAAIHQALKSVANRRSGERSTSSEEQFKRLKGSPGVMKVYWDRLLSRVSTSDIPTSTEERLIGSEAVIQSRVKGDNDALNTMYKALVEDGLQFWDKLSGHPVLESGVDSDRVSYSKESKAGGDGSPFDIILPLKYKTFIGNQAEIAMTVRILKAGLQSVNPEVSSFYDYFMEYLALIDYSMTVMNSPTNTGIEYTVKPTLPTYYAPICNVVMPQLVNSISVSSAFSDIPSRVMNVAYPIPGGPQSGAEGAAQAQTYTAPHSVRVARGGSGNLQDTLRPHINTIGKYEWGSGINPRLIGVPEIYNIMGHGLQRKEGSETLFSVDVSAQKVKAVNFWKAMYDGEDRFNPFSDKAGLTPWARMMILWVDQQYSIEAYRSRTAQAQGDFNPYPVVGYPMDIVDPSPYAESFHGLCVGVSHSISAMGSATTSYSMASVSTISELMMFKPPAVPPAMAATLGFEDDPGIYGNAKAYELACYYYGDVLGVGAAEPALLQDKSGLVRDFTRDAGTWSTDSNYSSSDQRVLIARNIVSLADFDFIQMKDWIDNGTVEQVDSYGRTTRVPNEASPFLDYED
jgi:hypothetical protein